MRKDGDPCLTSRPSKWRISNATLLLKVNYLAVCTCGLDAAGYRLDAWCPVHDAPKETTTVTGAPPLENPTIVAIPEVNATEMRQSPESPKKPRRKRKPTVDTTLDTPAAESPQTATVTVDKELTFNEMFSEACRSDRHGECPGCWCVCGYPGHKERGQ